MSEFNRIYLDTNIFIELVEVPGTIKNLLTDLVALNSQNPATRFVTSELTLSEVLVKPIAAKNFALASSYENILTDDGNFWVGAVIRQVLEDAAILRATYTTIKLPDAIHLATAFRFDCGYFLTFDKGLAGTHELPAEYHSQTKNLQYPTGKKPIQIIRPDKDTLEALLVAFGN